MENLTILLSGIAGAVLVAIEILLKFRETLKSLGEMKEEIKKLRGPKIRFMAWDVKSSHWVELTDRQADLGAIQAKARQSFGVYTGGGQCASTFDDTPAEVTCWMWDQKMGAMPPKP